MSKSSFRTKLHKLLDSAKTTKEIHDLLRICDLIHEGEEVELETNGKTIKLTGKDLPPDDVYEYYVNKINYSTDTSITKSTILFMSTIPKKTEIVEIKNALIIPKFDGASVAAKFTLLSETNSPLKKTNSPSKIISEYILVCANTRGKQIGTKFITSDVTDKINALIEKIKIDNSLITKYIKNELPEISEESENKSEINLNDIKILNIVMRGEIILNAKQLDLSTGNSRNNPCSEVSGKVNGKLQTFINFIDNICVQFYEIGYVEYIYNNKIYKFIPTQKQACLILQKMDVYYNYTDNVESFIANPTKALDAKIYTIPNTIETNFDNAYSEILDKCNYPTDGIVYCSKNWKYPQREEEFDKTTYGKYAWKPSSFHYVHVTKLEWPITRNGELNLIVHYTPFKYNGAVYEKCKMSIKQLNEFQKGGFGIGAEINVVIVNMKIAHIDNLVSPAEKVYEIPKKCPFCGEKLSLEDGKTKNSKHLMCYNKNCIEQKIQNYSFLVTNLAKVAKGKLIYKNKDGKTVKSGISEKKLRVIVEDHGDLNNDILMLYIPNLIEVLDSLEVAEQLTVLGFGGIKEINQIIDEDNPENWRDLRGNISWFN